MIRLAGRTAGKSPSSQSEAARRAPGALTGRTPAAEEVAATPSPPTKSFDFEGFDSSKLLILKSGNSHVRIIV